MKKLDDASATTILQTIAQARLTSESPDPTPSPGLIAALSAAFGDPSPAPASEGDLARAALDLLAEDPQFTEPIEVMSRGTTTANRRYLDPATIAVTTAALLVLQTRVKWKKDSTGKWSIEVEKKAAADGAVKLLVQRLLSLIG